MREKRELRENEQREWENGKRKRIVLKRTQKPFFSQPKQRTTKPSKKALAFGFSSRKRKQPSKKFKLLYKGRTIHNHGQIRSRITKKIQVFVLTELTNQWRRNHANEKGKHKRIVLKGTQKPFSSQPKQRTAKPSKKASAFGFSSWKRKQPSKKFKILYKGRTIHNHGQIMSRITKKSKLLYRQKLEINGKRKEKR